jgi:hypothetical protein
LAAEPVAGDDLEEIDPEFFLPPTLPVRLANHPHVRRNAEYSYGMMMEITDYPGDEVRYWLFPERTRRDLDETAETTGLPAFATEISPGSDYDRAYKAIFQATLSKFGRSPVVEHHSTHSILRSMGWTILSIKELQKDLLVGTNLKKIT